MAAFTYNENDQIASRKNNDGTLSLFAYNGAGDLVKQTIYDKYGNPIDSFSYTYDTKGNITSITSKSGTTTYEYDELDQLIKETALDGTITEYTYDAAGNRTSKKVTSDGTTTTTTYTYDDADQLTAVNGQAYRVFLPIPPKRYINHDHPFYGWFAQAYKALLPASV